MSISFEKDKHTLSKCKFSKSEMYYFVLAKLESVIMEQFVRYLENIFITFSNVCLGTNTLT